MPAFLERVTLAIKAARMVYGSGTGHGWLPWRGDLWGDPNAGPVYGHGESYDFTKSAGDLDGNAAVSICLGAINDGFGEARVEVVEQDKDGTWNEVPDHPAVALLGNPNPYDDAESLWTCVVSSYCVDGNAYLLKLRTRGGQVGQLEYLPHWQVTPVSTSKYERVSYYVYRVDQDEIKYEPSDIIHFRYCRDKHNPALGCSRLKALIREIASDNEATTYTAAILRNMGVVGGLVTVEDPAASRQLDTPAGHAMIAALKAGFIAMFTGANRGSLMVPTFPARWQDVGRSPEDLALDRIRQFPEDRICGALRVPIMVAGLTGGAAHKTHANYGEAMDQFWSDCIQPLQRRMASCLTRYLLAEFGDDITKRRVRWNYEEVAALQPDLDKISARTREEYKAGLITLNEAREKVAEQPVDGPEGDQFYQKPEKPALLGTGEELPESPGDLAARLNAPGRTREPRTALPAGVVANGKALKENGYHAPEIDVEALAEQAFIGLEEFWEGRSERWKDEVGDEEDEE